MSNSQSDTPSFVYSHTFSHATTQRPPLSTSVVSERLPDVSRYSQAETLAAEVVESMASIEKQASIALDYSPKDLEKIGENLIMSVSNALRAYVDLHRVAQGFNISPQTQRYWGLTSPTLSDIQSLPKMERLAKQKEFNQLRDTTFRGQWTFPIDHDVISRSMDSIHHVSFLDRIINEDEETRPDIERLRNTLFERVNDLMSHSPEFKTHIRRRQPADIDSPSSLMHLLWCAEGYGEATRSDQSQGKAGDPFRGSGNGKWDLAGAM